MADAAYQDQAPEVGDLRWIPITLIDLAEDNPRSTITDIDELAASIAAVGILSPVVVEEAGDRYRLVAGARRTLAARKAGLTELPALVRRFDEPHTRAVAMLVENGQRVALSPLEEGRAYAQVLALPGVEPEGLARQLGRPLAEIDGRLGVLALPRSVHKLLRDGSLTYAEALLLTELKEHRDDITAALKRHEAGYDMAQTVRHVRTERERLTRAEQTREALTAKGVRVVDDPGLSFSRSSNVRRLGSGYGAVTVKHSVHRKLPCHAAAIGWDGSAVYVCTAPQTHAGEAGSGVTAEPDAKAKRAATRTANQARRAASAARTAKVRELLASDVPVDTSFLCRSIVRAAPHDLATTALSMLQLEASEDDMAWERERLALIRYAATDADHAQRAALALQLAVAERDASAKDPRWGSEDTVVAYLDFLVAAGYEEVPGDATVRERYRRPLQDAGGEDS